MSDRLITAMREERDAALREAAFERGRANQALRQNDLLREEILRLRQQIKSLLGGHTEAPGVHPDSDDPSRRELELEDRLRLAMDTNWRLERDRARLEKRLESNGVALRAEQNRTDRLERRVRALEGQLRIKRS